MELTNQTNSPTGPSLLKPHEPPEDIMNSTVYTSSYFYGLPRLFEWFRSLQIDYITWLVTPLCIAFVLPIFIVMFVYFSSLALYIYRKHRTRLVSGLREAFDEGHFVKVGREMVSMVWDAQGYIWHGYEVKGMENIPDTGPALIVYYHGALPIDYYYFVTKIILVKRRMVHSVVDLFLFKIPGLKTLLEVFNCTPGTVLSCTEDLQQGNLLGLSPGGVYEAQFGDNYYTIKWKNRVGFARIAQSAKVPIIPMFTQNVRESFRSFGWCHCIFEWIYNKTRLPIVPVYGGFPVKLRTYVGKPIPYDENLSPEELRDRTKEALQNLIDTHQRVPGSICRALSERIVTKTHEG